MKEETFSEAIAEITKLNPRPGASLGEAIGRNLQQIVPDFIVETYDDGTINISLNNRNVPELRMSRDFTEMVDKAVAGTTMKVFELNWADRKVLWNMAYTLIDEKKVCRIYQDTEKALDKTLAHIVQLLDGEHQTLSLIHIWRCRRRG